MLASCGSADNPSLEDVDTKKTTQAVDPGYASRASFEAEGLLWPLEVNSAKIGCTDLARWVEVDGRRYGLNGLATVERGYAELEPIWSINASMAAELKKLNVPNDPPIRISVGDMIGEAGKLCE